jgi:hypothetical protein
VYSHIKSFHVTNQGKPSKGSQPSVVDFLGGKKSQKRSRKSMMEEEISSEDEYNENDYQEEHLIEEDGEAVLTDPTDLVNDETSCSLEIVHVLHPSISEAGTEEEPDAQTEQEAEAMEYNSGSGYEQNGANSKNAYRL